MTLRSLEIFFAVAKSGKMSKAASELHIAQPTISQAIAEIEREYGILLFNRLSRKLYITDAGRQLLSYAQNILSLVGEMEKQLHNLSTQKTLLLGATITVGKSVLVSIVERFEALYPNIRIEVTVDNTSVIEGLLLDSKLDVGLVEGDVKSTELLVVPAMPDQLVLICHPHHPFAGRSSVALEELSTQPFILREAGSGTRELFEDRLRQANIRLKPKWTCHGSDSIIEAVLSNQGITVISYRLVEPYIHEKKLCLVPIANVQMNRNFSLVYHKTKFIDKTLQKLLDFIIAGKQK